MEEALVTVAPTRRRPGRLLGSMITVLAAALVALLAVPACLLLGLACLVWRLADKTLDAMDAHNRAG